MLEITIEDCLELLAGFRKESDSLKLEKNDYTIMHSIAKQVFKGTALTDRQYALMKTKLIPYSDQFNNLDIDIHEAVKKLRQPLRSINREKYIRLIDGKIHVRFPFKKSHIVLINEITNNVEGYDHKKGTHIHSFDYTEKNILLILTRFSDKGFDIDKEIFAVWHEMQHMLHRKENYVPGIYDMQLKNVSEKIGNLLKNDIGELSKSNYIKYIDRRFKYGLEHFENKKPVTNLEKIAYRDNLEYQSKPSQEKLEHILTSLYELDRFPILFVLDKEQCEKQLHSVVSFYRDIIDSSMQSVLFRDENKDSGFNTLIKDRKLNNWVDKDTKIVYINNKKLPKLLVNNEWRPSVAFAFDGVSDRTLNTYIKFTCDLQIFREEYGSPFRRHSSFYG